MMPIEELQSMLDTAFPGDDIRLNSPMGDNNHFELLVVSDKFQGKTMIEQHQMVDHALGDVIREAVHALALKTYTPQQWAKASGG